MTIVKLKPVSSERHARNLRNYINNKEALLRDGQHVTIKGNWYREMDEIRELYGHNTASRRGAKNTTIWHQILAFLPDEADINGGPMTPEKCMEYAKEYAAKYYGDYMIAFALHKEKSPHVEPQEEARAAIRSTLPQLSDEKMSYIDRALKEVYAIYDARGRVPRIKELQSALRRGGEFEALSAAAALGRLGHDPCGEGKDERYAVHMAINRTNLETGRRLDEGKSSKAKYLRAERVRRMDEFWQLRQVERGVRNSKFHEKQPPVSRVEKEIEERGGSSYKADLRLLGQAASKQARDMKEFAALLAKWGATAIQVGNKIYVCDPERVDTKTSEPYRFDLGKLDPALSTEKLKETLHDNAVKKTVESWKQADIVKAQAQEQKESYVQRAQRAFEGYRKAAFAAKGKDYKEFPKLRLPKPPEGVGGDPDVQRLILKLQRNAEAMRAKYAKNVPVHDGKKGGSQGGGKARARTPEQEAARNRDKNR